ncbi:MAG TPA: zinc ribbon domain-containing protein [Bryobacteraceae bacterium]|nr:zinc ribbon domain-containing protein [Bryobacteraceae bacterium]
MTLVVLLYIAALAMVLLMNMTGLGHHGEPWPPGYAPPVRALHLAGITTGIAIPVACVLFLIGYVYRDARRREMNALLWTLLVIVLLPAYLGTGFIIYFLLRDPLPYHCPRCGAIVSARFNYCPRCKYNLQPTCPQCKREVGDADLYCPHCGNDLRPAPDVAPETSAIEPESGGS